MYVVIDDRGGYDNVIQSYELMKELLLQLPFLYAYEYTTHNSGDVYTILAKYSVLFEDLVVNQPFGTWTCQPEYLTYTFPNKCPRCKNDSFMKAKYCMLCDFDESMCPDCNKDNWYCDCIYTDF
jgi:hypothetical protein